MRIRKRPVPLPLSSLSPVPLSDPQLDWSPVVQLRLHNDPPHQYFPPEDDDTAAYFDPQSPNPPISGGSAQQIRCDGGDAVPEEERKSKDNYLVLFGKDPCGGGGGGGGGGDNRGRGEEEKSNIISRKETCFAVTETLSTLQQSSLSQVGRWCEGEKAFPLKKRRGNFERKPNEDEETVTMSHKKVKTKVKKKCNNQFETTTATATTTTSGAKKKGRGSALMEGSRCSRVNGRGWRCCQQTLVGYSLCEHHLGKGRLRSMTSVRSRSMAGSPKQNKQNQQQPPSMARVIEDEDYDDDDAEDKKKTMPISKKKMKLGVVKARSMSSLLGQANYDYSVNYPIPAERSISGATGEDSK